MIQMKKDFDMKIKPLETLYEIFIEQEDNYPSDQAKLTSKI